MTSWLYGLKLFMWCWNILFYLFCSQHLQFLHVYDRYPIKGKMMTVICSPVKECIAADTESARLFHGQLFEIVSTAETDT